MTKRWPFDDDQFRSRSKNAWLESIRNCLLFIRFECEFDS